MAYIVGLTATDGCLYTGLRKINFKSMDRELVETYRALLGRTNPIKQQRTRTGGTVYYLEFGDARLYRWFESIGLSSRKSLTLGPIDVPDAHLLPLVRGLFDGDGCIQNFTHRPTPSTYPNYVYERLWVFFTSASRLHIEWLDARLTRRLGLSGYIETRPPHEGRREFFRLKFGKRDAITLLRAMYPSNDVPKLTRKWAIWSEYEKRTRSNCAEGGI